MNITMNGVTYTATTEDDLAIIVRAITALAPYRVRPS